MSETESRILINNNDSENEYFNDGDNDSDSTTVSNEDDVEYRHEDGNKTQDFAKHEITVDQVAKMIK